MAEEKPSGTATAKPDTAKRKHRATYARDKRSGGYNIRVVGEYPERFAGREVPVTRKDDSEQSEKLLKLLWSGDDTDPETKKPTGRKAALYSFEPRPRDEQEETEF